MQIDAEQSPEKLAEKQGVVGIRPGTLGILFDGEMTDRRAIDGVVDEVVYYGDMTYYDVRIPGVDKPLKFAMKNIIGQPVLDVGAAAKVIWDARSLVLLK